MVIVISEGNLQAAIDDIQRSIDINVVGSLKATWAFLDLVKQGQLKKIVTVSSGMGDVGKLFIRLVQKNINKG